MVQEMKEKAGRKLNEGERKKRERHNIEEGNEMEVTDRQVYQR